MFIKTLFIYDGEMFATFLQEKVHSQRRNKEDRKLRLLAVIELMLFLIAYSWNLSDGLIFYTDIHCFYTAGFQTIDVKCDPVM